MLTNYQDFELLQSALHFNASDYLLKSGLKPEKLAAAIEKARQLHQERQQMQRYHWVQDYLIDHTQETLGCYVSPPETAERKPWRCAIRFMPLRASA